MLNVVIAPIVPVNAMDAMEEENQHLGALNVKEVGKPINNVMIVMEQ